MPKTYTDEQGRRYKTKSAMARANGISPQLYQYREKHGTPLFEEKKQARTYEYKGKQYTSRELARLAEMSPTAMRQRMRQWKRPDGEPDIERCVETPYKYVGRKLCDGIDCDNCPYPDCVV